MPVEQREYYPETLTGSLLRFWDSTGFCWTPKLEVGQNVTTNIIKCLIYSTRLLASKYQNEPRQIQTCRCWPTPCATQQSVGR